jgi:protoheme IX farnesyltransferase
MHFHSFSIKQMMSLTRPMLSLFVSFTSLATCIYFQRTITREAVFLFSGVFSLSCAASALNQLQERRSDSRMERTKIRPLPLGLFKVRFTTILLVILSVLGVSFLYYGANPVAAFMGAVTIFTYNGVYTPLKTKTPFALFPGALAGCLPVLIGCAAGLGRIVPKAVCVAAFVFLWQMPHFLLLLLRYETDYRRSGFATLLSRVSPQRLRTIIRIWTLATGGSTILFPALGIIWSITPAVIILGLCIILIFAVSQPSHGKGSISAIRGLYLYQGSVFAALIIQGLAYGVQWP